jgi:Protein of unknown function (DUF1579)
MTTSLASAASPLGSTAPGVPALLQNMEGQWTVTEKMWPGHGQPAMDLPPGTVHRRLVQQTFLEEVMDPAQASSGPNGSFQRISYLDFNATTQRFEYFSLDTRMPQIMNERSDVADPAASSDGIKLQGSHFVAPEWGKAHNVPFKYRLVVGEVKDDRQTVQLFLTPKSGQDRHEFLAFEYLYTRAR